jgi:hypothetical protein
MGGCGGGGGRAGDGLHEAGRQIHTSGKSISTFCLHFVLFRSRDSDGASLLHHLASGSLHGSVYSWFFFYNIYSWFFNR